MRLRSRHFAIHARPILCPVLGHRSIASMNWWIVPGPRMYASAVSDKRARTLAPRSPSLSIRRRRALRLGRFRGSSTWIPWPPRHPHTTWAVRGHGRPRACATPVPLGPARLGTDRQNGRRHLRGRHPPGLACPPVRRRRPGDPGLVRAADLLQARAHRAGGTTGSGSSSSEACDAMPKRETGPIWASITTRDARGSATGCGTRTSTSSRSYSTSCAGEMSLVGPRPERPIFVEKFRQHDSRLRPAARGARRNDRLGPGPRLARPHVAAQADPVRSRLHPALVVRAGFADPAHDHPTRLLGQDLVERIQAVESPGDLSTPPALGMPDRAARAALLGRHPDLQRPRAAASLPGKRRPPPAGRTGVPIEVDRRRRRLDRRNCRMAVARPIPRSGWSRLERNGGFCAAANAGHRRGAGRIHPAPQQRHRGQPRVDRGGPGALL